MITIIFKNKLILSTFLLEGFLILLNLLSFLSLVGVISADEDIQETLVKTIFVQQVDFAYDSVNFDDFISTKSYFTKLYMSFTGNSEEKFNTLMSMMKKNNYEAEAQHIMRSAAEKIHSVMRELKQDSIVIVSEFVTLVMQEAIHRLIILMYESIAAEFDKEDVIIPMSSFYISDNIKEDAGVTDYEPLG